jgi:hypothetical protein
LTRGNLNVGIPAMRVSSDSRVRVLYTDADDEDEFVIASPRHP